MSTIIDADQILVLEDGAVVGRGTHEELLETCGTYQEIVASQLTRGGGGMSTPEPDAEARVADEGDRAGAVAGGPARAAARSAAAWSARSR